MKMSLWCIVLVLIIVFSLTDQEPIRLVNGPSRCAGRVEIFYQNRWGPVCDDNWDTRRGEVVCRQLDCGMVLSAPGNAAFGFETDQFWLDDVNCNGTESKLSDCQARPWGVYDCRIKEAASAVCSGDLAKPNISLSALSSGGLRLTCTVPPLYQSVVVYFYQTDAPTPITTIPLNRTERIAVHDIGAEVAIRGAYLCQYEVAAVRTPQSFLSPRSETGTVEQENMSSAGPPTSTTEGSFSEKGTSQVVPTANTNGSLWEKGSSRNPPAIMTDRSPLVTVLPATTPIEGFVQEVPGPNATILAASIVVVVVVLSAVVAGLAFICIKRRRDGNAVKKSETATENINEGKFMDGDATKVRAPTRGNGRVIQDNSIHHYENQPDGRPGTPHIYERVTLPSQPSGPLKDSQDHTQEQNGVYEVMVENNYSPNPSNKNEGSTYQALSWGTLRENAYDTLKHESI